jgi:predicted permease
MGTLAQDLRYALRGLAKSPGFTAAAVATLALGIGANSAIFSIVNLLMIRPMTGLAEPDRLAWVTHVVDGRPRRISYLDALDYEQAGVFSSLSAVDRAPVHLATSQATERVAAQIASGDYFALLGVVPAAGRFFTAEDDRARRPVTVVSTAYAMRRFGSETAAVGAEVLLNGRPFTIAGVAPPGFHGLDIDEPRDVYVPAETFLTATGRSAALSDRGDSRFYAIARLKPGTTREEAASAVAAVAARNAVLRTADRRALTTSVEVPRGWVPPGHLSQILPFVAIGLAATGLVVLIATANVANLLLGRASRRRRELGIRLAIGASRGRLIRQLLTESLVLAGLGAGAGVLLSWWLVDLGLSAFEAPALIRPVLDGGMLLYAVAIALVTGVLFGLAPAWRAARPDLVAALRDDSTGGVRGRRLQSALVVAQIALSLVLLASGGLLLRSLAKAARVPVGFDRDSAEDVLAVSFDTVTQGYSAEDGARFREALLERARALPGVRAAALTEVLPLSERAIADDFAFQGGPADVRERSYLTSVSPGYFATLGIALVAGRDFTAEDRSGSPRVAVVNETLARQFWPGQSPLGRRLVLADDPTRNYEVIGVAADGKYQELTESSLPFVYLALAQESHVDDATLVVRGAHGVSPASALRVAARELDPSLPLFQTRTLAESLGAKSAPRRTGTFLLAIFGGLALLLSAVGLYGVVAFAVGARRREIGIRVALGATRRDVVSLFLGSGARLAGAGVAIGLLLAAGATRLLSSMLFGVTPMDVTTLAGVSALLFAIALAASGLPARRAARTDPALVLRGE